MRVARAVRRRFGSSLLGRGGSEPRQRPVAIAPDAPIASIAQALDIGAADHIVGERLAYDIPSSQLATLLTSVLAAAEERRQTCFVQEPGRIVRLRSAPGRDPVRSLGGRPMFRLFIVDANGELIENLCITTWRKASDSWVTLSDQSPVGRIVKGGAAAPTAPVLTDASYTFPIDAVYTWVNAADPAWRAEVAKYRDVATLGVDRFAQSDELRYSLRSLDLFAPWIRRIFVLTNCAPPTWFRPSDRVRWIDHRDVVDEGSLPLFNSRAIETFLHRIPDLAEHFVYLNDDVIVWDNVFPSTFFTFDGKSIAHLNSRPLVIYWQQLLDAGQAETYQAARVNGARLIRDRYGFLPTRSHQHVPFAFRRTFVDRMEQDFPDEFRAERASRFRDLRDFTLMSFVYHHWAVANGLAVAGHARDLMLNARGPEPLDQARLAEVDFICLNDTGGSSTDPKMQRFKADFFGDRLPIRSSAELGPT